MPKIKLLVININFPELSQFVDIDTFKEFMVNKNIFEYIFFAIFEAHNGKAGKRIHIKIKATEGNSRAIQSVVSFIDLLYKENKTNQMAVKDPEKYMSDKYIETNSKDYVSSTNSSHNYRKEDKPGFIRSNRNFVPGKNNSVFIKPGFLKQVSANKADLPNGGILEAGISILKNKQQEPFLNDSAKEKIAENKKPEDKKKITVKINASKFRKNGRQYDR